MGSDGQVVVTVSRQRGSGGDHIAQIVAERRGLRYIDAMLLRDAAEYVLVHDPNLEQVQKQVASIWTRLGELFAVASPQGPAVMAARESVSEADLFRVANRIIQEIGEHHSAVIVGRGAGHVVRGLPGLVRVFLHAPESWRADRVAEREGLPRARAVEVVRESDRGRAAFIRALTSMEWTDARQYDLAIDTATTGPDLAAELILKLVSAVQA